MALIFTYTAPALLITTFVLVMGFGVLIFANFVPNINFGILVAITFTVALITDLSLLPAILFATKSKTTKSTIQQPEKLEEDPPIAS